MLIIMFILFVCLFVENWSTNQGEWFCPDAVNTVSELLEKETEKFISF